MSYRLWMSLRQLLNARRQSCRFARRHVAMNHALDRAALNLRLRFLERRRRRLLVAAVYGRLHLLDEAAHATHARAIDGRAALRLPDALLCGLMVGHDAISLISRIARKGRGLYPPHPTPSSAPNAANDCENSAAASRRTRPCLPSDP